MIQFAYQNKADSAIVTASSELVTLPATNVQQIWRSRVWRTTGDTSEWIMFDMGAATAVRAFALIGHNLTSGAVVHVQANATDVWTAPSVDIAIAYHSATLVYLWSTDQSFRYWRITLADSSNPDGFIDVGRIYLGPTTTPERNYRSWGREDFDNTAITPSYDGAESFESKSAYTTLAFEFERVLPAPFDALAAAAGMKSYFFVIADYDNAVLPDGRHDLTRYVRFDGLPQYTYSHLSRQDITINLVEAL